MTDPTFLINFLTALWFGAVGACVGSFINVAAYRWPLGVSVVWRNSRCPRCGTAIRAWHNVPVLGWLLLRGRCYDCKAPIAPRYAIVEAVLGMSFVALAYGELYCGGANLPEGPLTRSDDALDMFLRPSWPLLWLTAAHAALAGVLGCLALLHYDRLAAPLPLAATGALLALLVAAFLPEGFSRQPGAHLASWRGDDGGAAWIPAIDGLVGAALGWGPLAWGWASGRRGAAARSWWNAALGVGTVGGVLGVRGAAAALLAAAVCEGAAAWLPRRVAREASRWTWAVGGCAALIVLLTRLA